MDRESADVEVHPELFDLSLASGVPPDRFSGWGQLWGSPPYRWGELRRQGYRWWIERFRRSLELVDVIRLDHFRGLVAYWAVRHGSRSAKKGRWLRGPGMALFDAVFDELGQLPLVVEDLGYITPPVRLVREKLDAPGMHILQWAFSENPKHREKLTNHREFAVVYTGTHDNDPVAGWWNAIPRRVQARVEAARLQAGIVETDPSWVLIELALSSRSRLAIVQAQDVLGLDSEARMNRPATIGRNWHWRLQPGQLTREHAERMREATRRWQRLSA